MKKSSKYVSAFVIPVPKKKLTSYQKIAKLSAKLWLEHGAIEYTECMSDDIQKGKVTSWPQSAKLKSGEVLFLNWVTFKSAKHCEQVMNKVMNDPRMSEMDEMPFDGMRMFWGGFKTMINL